MALAFQDYEDQTYPRQVWTETVSGVVCRMYRRRYNLPPEGSSLIPAKGAVVELLDVTVEATALLKPRVFLDPVPEHTKQLGLQVTMTFYQPQAV